MHYYIACASFLVYSTPPLHPTGVFGMNFKTPLFDDTEPFTMCIYIYYSIAIACSYMSLGLTLSMMYSHFTGVFGMNFKTPLSDDTEPFTIYICVYYSRYSVCIILHTRPCTISHASFTPHKHI